VLDYTTWWRSLVEKLSVGKETSTYTFHVDVESHLIPQDKSLWRREKYSEFITERRKLVKQAIDNVYTEFK